MLFAEIYRFLEYIVFLIFLLNYMVFPLSWIFNISQHIDYYLILLAIFIFPDSQIPYPKVMGIRRERSGY